MFTRQYSHREALEFLGAHSNLMFLFRTDFRDCVYTHSHAYFNAICTAMKLAVFLVFMCALHSFCNSER